MAGTPVQHIVMLRNQLQDSSKALEDETRQKTELKASNEQLTDEIRTIKEGYAKLEKHTKNCEKATSKAQKDAKNARGHADHLINSQKGQLKSAERRYETAARDLQEWRDKYGWSVEKPAEEKNALQVRLSEWQSKAEKARHQITLLEQQIEGTPQQIGLHQALEEWEEHKGCSIEFANLEDKLHDAMLAKQKLESDFAGTREKYQKAKSDMTALQNKVNQVEPADKDFQASPVTPDQLKHAEKTFQELQIKADQLEQANKTSQESHVAPEQLEQANKEFQELQSKVAHLEQVNKTLQDQDVANDYVGRIQKLESDLKASKEQHQRTEEDLKALQDKANQLEQSNDAFRDKAKTDADMLDEAAWDKEKLDFDITALQKRHQQTESDLMALQGKYDQLEQANKVISDKAKIDVNLLDEAARDKKKLNSDIKDFQKRHQRKESDLKALQEKHDQLEQANKALRDQDKSQNDRRQSDLQVGEERFQEMESNMKALQAKADIVESDLKTANEQHRTTKLNMEAIQGKADQFELDLKTANEQHRTTKLNMEAIQGKADQFESDLKTANEQHRTTKSDMEALQADADRFKKTHEEAFQRVLSELDSMIEMSDEQDVQLEEAREKNRKDKEAIEEKVLFYQQAYHETLESIAQLGIIDEGQVDEQKTKIKDRVKRADRSRMSVRRHIDEDDDQIPERKTEFETLVQRAIEEGTKFTAESRVLEDSEQETKTQQPRIETLKEAENGQVSSSPYLPGFSFLPYLIQHRLLDNANTLQR